MAIVDNHGPPVALQVESASLHEVKLVRKTHEGRFLLTLTQKLIGDKVYDSDPLDIEPDLLRIEMIAPHRGGRKRLKTQDGRPLWRYRHR